MLVTVGAAEANYLAINTHLEPGDEVVIVLPNYMQVWGVAKNRGVQIRRTSTFDEDRKLGARIVAELDEAVTGPGTKMICVCNPNNPTGRILRIEAEMDAIVAAAERCDAWILADEVYTRSRTRAGRGNDLVPWTLRQGASPSGSMSKAYGLPGLRLGWAVGPAAGPSMTCGRGHEYTTIATTMISNHLTATALSPKVRPQILARTKLLLKGGYGLLGEWLGEQDGVFQGTPPDAAAIAFLKYDLDIGSTEWMEQLRDQRGVLLVPGDHFGLDKHIRLSFAVPEPELVAGLARIHESVVELRK